VSEQNKQQKSAIIRNLLVLLFLLLASWVVWLNLQKRALINQENEAIRQMDAGKPAAALQIFRQLRLRLRKDQDLQRIDRYLADCYLQLAENPANNTDVSLHYYRRVFRLAPDKVPEAIRLRLNRELSE